MKPGALNCFVFPVSTVTIERDVGSADAWHDKLSGVSYGCYAMRAFLASRLFRQSLHEISQATTVTFRTLPWCKNEPCWDP